MATILVVEDNISNMELATFLLESAGRVLGATNAEAGVTVARERQPDLGCDGYIAKPLRYQEFLASIAARLERS